MIDIFGKFFNDIFQLIDILKFGVDDLLKDDDSTDVDIDLTKLLGPSVNGEWQVKEEETEDEKAEENDEEVRKK